jgi:predicted O-linked N-acetylglucosamine transferase (SPINDLY family)
MAILRRVEGSVLWLLPDSDEVLATLRIEAAKHVIEPARLIPVPRTDPLTHVSRGALADLFLDTFVCNAHTTASDALWSGLPVLTYPGETFASRVAASIVSAAGLAELVCSSADDYEETAVALAQDPERLAALRQRLMETRETCPLFDTAALVRDLEATYRAMI